MNLIHRLNGKWKCNLDEVKMEMEIIYSNGIEREKIESEKWHRHWIGSTDWLSSVQMPYFIIVLNRNRNELQRSAEVMEKLLSINEQCWHIIAFHCRPKTGRIRPPIQTTFNCSHFKKVAIKVCRCFFFFVDDDAENCWYRHRFVITANTVRRLTRRYSQFRMSFPIAKLFRFVAWLAFRMNN